MARRRMNHPLTHVSKESLAEERPTSTRVPAHATPAVPRADGSDVRNVGWKLRILIRWQGAAAAEQVCLCERCSSKGGRIRNRCRSSGFDAAG